MSQRESWGLSKIKEVNERTNGGGGGGCPLAKKIRALQTSHFKNNKKRAAKETSNSVQRVKKVIPSNPRTSFSGYMK